MQHSAIRPFRCAPRESDVRRGVSAARTLGCCSAPWGRYRCRDGRGRRKASARRTFRPAGRRQAQRLPVDWQFAVPIAPAGDEVIVTASVWAKLPSYPGGEVTSELCAQRIQASRPPEPLDPPLELQPDKVFTTDRQIFNFVLPPSLAVGT